MTQSVADAPLRFGRFELQTTERRLLVDGVPAALGGRAFDLLLALAQRPGRLVGKRALIELVWPGLVVQDNNLAAQMSALRKVLGDEVIATIPGRGYRFVARLVTGTEGHARRDEPHAVAAAASLEPPAPRTNLPASMPELLGRANDVAVCGALIDAHRLVSIVGAGGIGKSLLAAHLLAERRARFPQGVCWVELATVTDAAALPAAVAVALGADNRGIEPLAALTGAVAPLSMLLALDNAEHLLDGVASLVQNLLAAAPGLHVVVTSQAPLKLAAERVVRIDPLAVPATALPAAQALTYGAVALFVERAQAADARFALTDATAPLVIDICRALDGLPLAIELAAARVALLGLQQLLASMQDRLLLLTTGRDRHAPLRQRTLRAALEWSHGLLAPREQRVFRRLGVVAGSAALEFIQQVLADPDGGGADALDEWSVLDALDDLVERSLVAVVALGDDEIPRYRLLDSPRALALQLLEAAGERDELQRRHARAMAVMLEGAYDDFFSGHEGVDDWLARLELDLDNARDALTHARAVGDAELELTIGATLLRAVPASGHAERMALADACVRQLTAASDTIPAALTFRVWLELSCVWANPQKHLARDAALRAVALARDLVAAQSDRFLLCHALARAASASAQIDDVAGAAELLREAQAIEDPHWPAQRRLWVTEAAQWVARMSGNTAEALRRGRDLVTLDRARGSVAFTAVGNLIDAELAAGDVRSAAQLGCELVAALHGTRHEDLLTFAHINLGAAWLALGDAAQARPVLQAAWQKAPAFELTHATAAYLALLAVLEQRPRSSARLQGYAQAEYEARRETLEVNEATALERAATLARGALGDAAFERTRAEGAALQRVDVGAVAFGLTDT
ncbi:MAG TPA: winged helix-turn-helix domain-containing protein [Burkholderiaceae bacterium]|nr:winged helix-turn-helix domain-containing protein [Burkholderiaceae bacterium]